MLVPAALAFLLFMGTEGRYFGRWLMPVLPILSLLAAFAAREALGALPWRRRQRDASAEPGGGGVQAEPGAAGEAGPGRGGAAAGARRPARRGVRALGIAAAAVVVLALLAQGLGASVHSGLILSRADTRTQTRDWMLANIPRGTKVVVEPVSPDQWAREERGRPGGLRRHAATGGASGPRCTRSSTPAVRSTSRTATK